MVADFEARRERWGIYYIMTHEPFMDALAPSRRARVMLRSKS